MRSHFWPFTEVVRIIGREVTRKVVEAAVLQRQPCRLRKDKFFQCADDTPADTAVTSAELTRPAAPIIWIRKLREFMAAYLCKVLEIADRRVLLRDLSAQVLEKSFRIGENFAYQMGDKMQDGFWGILP